MFWTSWFFSDSSFYFLTSDLRGFLRVSSLSPLGLDLSWGSWKGWSSEHPGSWWTLAILYLAFIVQWAFRDVISPTWNQVSGKIQDQFIHIFYYFWPTQCWLVGRPKWLWLSLILFLKRSAVCPLSSYCDILHSAHGKISFLLEWTVMLWPLVMFYISLHIPLSLVSFLIFVVFSFLC